MKALASGSMQPRLFVGGSQKDRLDAPSNHLRRDFLAIIGRIHGAQYLTGHVQRYMRRRKSTSIKRSRKRKTRRS